MLKLLYILSVALFFAPAALYAQAEKERDTLARKKVALVLSGGGAKGAAHIGVLKVIERAGIPIDMVVGTSMGAVVGGLYSIGYTPDQLDSMVMAQNWGFILSDRPRRRNQPYSQKEVDDRYQVSYPFGKKLEGVGGLIKGANLEMLFNDLMVGHHDPVDFSELPIPFACVASEIVTGTEKVFHEGVLPVAMRASMAIPGVFTPVYTDSEVLLDGGLVNNYPVDVAIAMGAEVIIGVDVQSSLKPKEELMGAAAILGQVVDLAMQQQTFHDNVSMTDLYIKVDVQGYSSASFNLPALDSLIRRGEESADQHYEALLSLKDRIGIDEVFVPEPREPYIPLNKLGEFHVYKVTFEGLGARERKWVMRNCRMKENSEMSITDLNRCMSVLSATTSHSNIYYSLRDTVGGYNLNFHMDAIMGNSISAGVEFDTEEIASVLINGTFRYGRKMPMETSITGRYGKRLSARLDQLFYTSPLSSFRLTYIFNHDDVDIYSNGQHSYNPTWNRHFASFSFVNMSFLRQSLRLELGLAYHNYSYVSWLSDFSGGLDRGDNPLEVDDEMFVSYYAKVDFETLDSRYFTTRGSAFSINFELFTDDFYRYKEHAPFSALSASWMTAFPISRNFSLIPSAYGRVLIGTDIPFPMLNMVGGRYFGRYVGQQMPFDGIRFVEAAPNAFMATKIQARQRIARHHYVSASFNYALADNNFLDLLATGRNYFGASIDYGYELRNFPLMASFSWSSITRRVSFYVQAGYTF